MSIADLGALKIVISDFLARSDAQNYADTWVSLFEQWVKRNLRVSDMETTLTGSTVGGTAEYDLPTDYLELRSLYIPGATSRLLSYVTPQRRLELGNTTTTGMPCFYTIMTRKLTFIPVPDATYDYAGTYYSFTELNGSSSTNWLLENYSDAYLYGSLVHAADWYRDDNLLAQSIQRRDAIIAEIKRADSAARWGGAPLVIPGGVVA